MKREYKMYGFAIAGIMFVLGIYLLGQAGASYLLQDSNVLTDSNSGELFSSRGGAIIRFIAGFVITVLGVLLYLIFLRKKNDEEDF